MKLEKLPFKFLASTDFRMTGLNVFVALAINKLFVIFPILNISFLKPLTYDRNLMCRLSKISFNLPVVEK